jgi:hypothetical protein
LPSEILLLLFCQRKIFSLVGGDYVAAGLIDASCGRGDVLVLVFAADKAAAISVDRDKVALSHFETVLGEICLM